MYVVWIIISGMELVVIETRTYACAFSSERAQITCKGVGIVSCDLLKDGQTVNRKVGETQDDVSFSRGQE